MCFISFNIAFWIPFGFENSFTTNWFCSSRQFNKILNAIVFHWFYLIFHGIYSCLGVYTLFDLTKRYWIIFQSYIKLMFLEIHNIIIQNHRSPLLSGSPQWHLQLKLLLLLYMSGSEFFNMSKRYLMSMLIIRICILHNDRCNYLIIISCNSRNRDIFLFKHNVLEFSTPTTFNILKKFSISYIEKGFAQGIIKLEIP